MLTFKMARKRKMLTQKELAELVGVSTGTISKIETGKGISRIYILTELANILE